MGWFYMIGPALGWTILGALYFVGFDGWLLWLAVGALGVATGMAIVIALLAQGIGSKP